MKLALNKNLNNLNQFWQSLDANKKNDIFSHQSWPNKQWKTDFTLPSASLNWLLPVNKSYSTLTDVSDHEVSKLGLVVKNQLVAMSLSLKTDDGTHIKVGEKHSKIVKLNIKEDATRWAVACGQAFGYEIDASVIQGLLKDSNASVFSYMVDDQIAGTAISYKSGDTLGIHQLGTVSSFRKMGIAASLMQHLLSQANSEGAHFVTLQASKAGLHLYERLGFQALGKITSLMRSDRSFKLSK